MNPIDDALLATLDAATRSGHAGSALQRTLTRVTAMLAASNEVMAWETVPLSLFGVLPAPIQSCWLFVLRAGTDTGAERHPNSHQRSLALTEGARAELWEGNRWMPHPLRSAPEQPLDRRWASIPPLTWHRWIVGPTPFAVLSFHTVPVPDLIEERPVTPDALDGPTRLEAYHGRP